MSAKRRFIAGYLILSVGIFCIYPQIVPHPSMENYIKDLENFRTPGTRQISGSITDYLDIQGAIQLTNEGHDYAIMGYGFFKILNHIDGSVYYTRCGKFTDTGTAFVTEDNDIVVLHDNEYKHLCNADINSACIYLYYPKNKQDIEIIDNKNWKTATGCKVVKGNVVFNALEQNPVELWALLRKIKNELDNTADQDTAAVRKNCIGLIEAIQKREDSKMQHSTVDQETAKKVKELVFELNKLKKKGAN